jgi:hypothetical protein
MTHPSHVLLRNAIFQESGIPSHSPRFPLRCSQPTRSELPSPLHAFCFIPIAQKAAEFTPLSPLMRVGSLGEIWTRESERLLLYIGKVCKITVQ